MQPYGSVRTSFGDAREPIGGGRSVPLDLKRTSRSWSRSRARAEARDAIEEFLAQFPVEDRRHDESVANDGTVSPNYVCPHAPCGFHQAVRLGDWTPPDGRTR